jgi:hypothetical protein
VYSIVLGSTSSMVSGGGINSPVQAYYPGPGVLSLIVTSPIAQRLPPRSTDRFRIMLRIDDATHLLGPMKDMSIDIQYNGTQVASSSMLSLTTS